MLWSVLQAVGWQIPFLVVSVIGVVVALRAPLSARWRVLAAAGFGLDVIGRVVVIAQQLILVGVGYSSIGSISVFYGVFGAVTSLISLVSMILLVVAFARAGRDAAGSPAAGQAWQQPAPSAAYAAPGQPLQQAPAPGWAPPPATPPAGPSEVAASTSLTKPDGPSSTDPPQPGAGA